MAEYARMGVIGLGTWGQNHALAYSDYHRSRLVCVCDLDEAKAKDTAERYACDYTTDAAQLVGRDDVDAVAVATPDFAHLEPCLAVLDAGKHLIVEKPLAMRSDEARRIVQARRKAGVQGMTDFQMRWRPDYLTIKRAIQRGRIGTPVTGSIHLSDALSVASKWLSWAAQSGPHWFLMCHTMDLMRWLIEQEPREVYAVGSKGVLAGRGVDTYDTVHALVRFDTASVAFESSWIIPDTNPTFIDSGLTLQGTTGRIVYNADGGQLQVADEKRFGYPGQATRSLFGRLDNPLFEPMRYFVDCALDGKEPEASLEDGYAVTAMLEATVRSMTEGRAVPIDTSV